MPIFALLPPTKPADQATPALETWIVKNFGTHIERKLQQKIKTIGEQIFLEHRSNIKGKMN